MPLAKQVTDPETEGSKLHSQLLDYTRCIKYDDKLISLERNAARAAATRPAPKFRIHEGGMDSELAAEVVRKHLSLDGNPALNLASFVHTGIDEVGLQLAKENITKNLADSDEYPALLELQQRCVSILSNLWNVPKGELGVGTATTGSSEAIMLGGLAMKRRWEARQKEKGRPFDKPNIIMGANAQVALEKFARYFDVELRLLPVEAASHYSFSMDSLRENLDENTIGVFSILGSTFTGHYQDVQAVAKVLDEYEEKSGNFVPIHVDGASGAFVAPFITPDLVWDFRIPRVLSINTSGHKYGLSPVGSGWIIWRDQKYLPENLLFTLNYLGGSEVTYTLNFSRPGHPIIYQYYSLLRLGFEGYQNVHSISLENARYLSLYLEASGYFDVLSDIHRPKGEYYKKSGEVTYDNLEGIRGKENDFFNPGLPVVSFKLTDSFKESYPYIPQEAVSHMLRGKGYILPNYPLPPSEDKNEVLRIVVNDNIGIDLLDQLAEDIVRVTNRLIKTGEGTFSGAADKETLLKAIRTLAEADHSEEEHEKKWNLPSFSHYGHANSNSHNSRC